MELGEFALSLIIELLGGAIEQGVDYATLPYFQRRKIERRVEDATAEIVEPLLPFLTHEGVSEDKQRRLIQTCVGELRPLTEQPEDLFQGSLDGQKIFDELYADRDLPEAVIEDGLGDVYSLLCPRIATLLCKIPAAVKDWEAGAWAENYRRFDEIVAQLQVLFTVVDELATLPAKQADETLTMVRRALAQKIRLELDLTGLRADRPLEGKFEDFFVHPEITEEKEEKNQPRRIGTSIESFNMFTSPGNMSIVIGAPGAGKSTWAKWLQREALSAHWTGTGIRVELRSLSNGSLPSLHDLIRNTVGKHFAEELTAERIRDWLNAKLVAFILDGFDEIRPGERDNILDWILELKEAGGNCPFVLTSRPLTTDHLDRLGKDWTHWLMEPFDEDRIIDYIQRWYNHMPLLSESDREVDATSLANSWLSDPSIGPLTGNPLLLSTLLMVHHLDGRLPGGRSQLYRRYVEGMLGVWDDRRKVKATAIHLSLEQKRLIMRGLSLHMFLEEQEQMDEGEVLEWLQGILRELNISFPAEDVLTLLRERSGLIIGPGIYSFAHKSVAEYLVAESVLQGDQHDNSGERIDRFFLFEQRGDDRWNTVTFLWAGLASVVDLEAFIDECLESEVWDLGYGLLADQYERVTSLSRRSFLLRIPTLFEDEGLVAYGRWEYSGPTQFNSDDRLPVPMFSLRGLGLGKDFGALLAKSVDDMTLSWADAVGAVREFRDFLWMHTILHGWKNSLDQWKECLSSECPSGDTTEHWLYWAADYTVGRCRLEGRVNDLKGLIGAFKEVRPIYRGLLPLALMDDAILAIDWHEAKDLPPYISQILNILPDSDDGQTMPTWLAATRSWVIPDADHDPIVFDLIESFLETVENLAEHAVIEKDDIYKRAIAFVEQLKTQRESIPES